MRFRLLLTCLLTYFAGKAVLYAVAIPPWQAPDETLHFEVAELRHRAGPGLGRLTVDPYLEGDIVTSLSHHDFWRLTGQIEPDPPPRTLGSSLVEQALPLYYNLAALAFYAGRSGTLLHHLYAGRLLSVALGMAAVALTACSARRLFGNDPGMLAGAAGALAFLPQLGYMAGTLSSDMLVVALASATCCLAVTVITGAGPRWVILLGVSLLCLLTKRNLYYMVPLVLMSPLLAEGARGRKLLWWISGVGLALLAFAVGPVRTTATRSLHQAALHLELLERTPAGWWGRAASTFYRSSWASLGWLRFDAPAAWYRASAVVLLIALAGLSAVVLRWSWGRASLDKARARGIAWLAVVVCLGMVQVLLGLGLSGEDLPQGRHLFPALPALSLLLAFGLRSALPGRLGVAMVVAALVFLLAFDLFVMWQVALVGFYL